MFGSLGSTELIVVLVVVLIVFGAGKLPSVMRDLGKGVSEFKKAQSTEPEAVTAGPVAPAPVAVVAPKPAVFAEQSVPAVRVPDTAPRA